MYKTFYLVRHGEKVKQIGDPPLSKKGIEQAKQTAIFFKSIQVTKILTSPYRRTKETAKYIAMKLPRPCGRGIFSPRFVGSVIPPKRKGLRFDPRAYARLVSRRGIKLDLEVDVTDLLKERFNWGDDPKQNFNEFISIWEKSSKNRSWKPPFGDSSVNSGKRMEQVIGSFMSRKDENIVLVTHGGIISDYLRNIFPNEVMQFTNDDFIFDNAIAECSITTIVYDKSVNKLILADLASVKHLNSS